MCSNGTIVTDIFVGTVYLAIVLSITVQGITGYFPVLQRKDEHTV
jgi:hypothetical protein